MNKEKCTCEFCILYAELKAVKMSENFPRAVNLLDKLFELWFYTSDDLDYAEAVLDGSWPTAIEQLEDSLAEAKRIRKELDERETSTS